VKGISCDKPIAAVLSDADDMVEICDCKGIVLAGDNL
jgi:predicted dehydrogenase